MRMNRYCLYVDDFHDPLPSETTEFKSLEDARASIGRRWPDAVLDAEWKGGTGTPTAYRYVYPNAAAQDQFETAAVVDSAVCGILYRDPA